MRINQAGNPVQGAETSAAKRAGKASAAQEGKQAEKKASTSLSDSVKPEISARGKEMAQAKAIASQAPDVREEKIAELKRRISAGAYEVDADAVADRMVDDHLKTGIG